MILKFNTYFFGTLLAFFLKNSFPHIPVLDFLSKKDKLKTHLFKGHYGYKTIMDS